MICSSCGFSNSTAARFCGGCGSPLVRTEGESTERRQITVLMCDLVGSTALSQRLDPEDLRDLLTDYQHVCEEAVERHDGHIAQYLGDGVLAYFGYPKAHEDDAKRAVRCGLDILSGMQALNHAAAKTQSIGLQVRIGVHTGRVVVGSVGSGLRREQLAQGDTPNIAARLQNLAAPDTLLISDTTWRLVKPAFDGEDVGEHELKGISEPIRLWRVTHATLDETLYAGASETTRYIGRARQHRVLEAEWTTAFAGAARFVTVRGEPGIGKSRLVSEFRHGFADREVDILTMRCTSYTSNSAFQPVIDLIEQRLGLEHGQPTKARLDRIDARLAELGISASDSAPLLAMLLSIPADGRYPPLESTPGRQRTRTFETLLELLRSLSAQLPTLLIVEDLHWADASTLELLDLIVASLAGRRLMGLFTTRPEFLPAWSNNAAATLINVPHLDAAEAEDLARSVAHDKPLPGQVIREIIKRCDGVPLFVEEVTRSVIESGVLEEHDHSWELVGPLPADLIPASVDASLMSRIDRLGPSRITAQLAAAIGREYSFELLRAVSERDAAELEADLDRLVDAGLVREADVGHVRGYVFKHALVQAAAYESLLRSTRAHLHARIALVLRRDFPDEAERRPEVVARHLSGAGQHEQASDYWSAAGARALARMAVPEAHGHYSQALEGIKSLPETPDTLAKELDLQIAIAPTLMTVHGWAAPSVAEACERARSLCIELQCPDKLYAPVWGLWTNRFVSGQLESALVTANEALEMAKASTMPMLEVTGRHALSYTHYYRGEWAEAIGHAKAGIALYNVEQERALTSTFQISSTVNLVAALGSSLWMQGYQERGLAELERMIAIARDIRHPSALSNALGVACYMLTFHRDASRMLRYATEVKGFARDEGWELWYAVGVMSSGWSRLRLGQKADGLSELFEGVALFRATGSDLMGPTVGVIHGEGLHAAGRSSEALAMLAETVTKAERGHVGLLLPEVHRLAGTIHLETGALADAETSFTAALDTAAAQQALSLELRAALSYQALLERTGRRAEGLALVQKHLDRFTEGHQHPDLVQARGLLVAAVDRA
jgi:class 3 adenylate cyclase/tetratricopeptide (TPR) repeat protein